MVSLRVRSSGAFFRAVPLYLCFMRGKKVISRDSDLLVLSEQMLILVLANVLYPWVSEVCFFIYVIVT